MNIKATSKVKTREHFLELLDLKMNLTGATVEEIASFLEVGANYIYQIRSSKVRKMPSDKLLNRLKGFEGKAKESSQVMKDAASQQEFIRVELKSGNVFHLPIPPGPDGYERAVAAAAALERASRLEQATVQQAVEDLKKQGLSVPVPPAEDNR